MLNNITITGTINTNNILYKINPVIKILSIILLLFLSFFCNQLTSHIAILCTILLLIYLSKINFQVYLKGITHSLYFLISIFFFNLFFITILESFIVICRMIELILYSKIILHTTSISGISYGITKLCSPLKIINLNPLFFSMSITLTIRFIPILLTETNNTLKSLKLKGIYFTKNLKKNIWIICIMMKPIFKNAIMKADNISTMMEIKNFSFDKERSNYISYKINIFDILFSIIILIIDIMILKGEIL